MSNTARLAIVYTVLLICFTLYLALDTFVIEHAYVAVGSGDSETETAGASQRQQLFGSDVRAASAQDGQTGEPDDAAEAEPAFTIEDTAAAETDGAETEQAAQETWFTEFPTFTESTYTGPNANITITQFREYDSTVYVADVRLSSPGHLKTALAKNAYGRNIKDQTSNIAKENGAIFAVNGDFYGARSEGFVIRNGELYREDSADDREALVIWEDGSFEIVVENDTDADDLLAQGAAQVLSFGPALLADGEITVSENDDHGRGNDNPRTAIGIIGPLHYMFLVSDGRTDESEGLTYYELAEIMQSLGADIAYNLDGGGSSAMYFNGVTVNVPTADGDTIRERRVSDIVYIQP